MIVNIFTCTQDKCTKISQHFCQFLTDKKTKEEFNDYFLLIFLYVVKKAWHQPIRTMGSGKRSLNLTFLLYARRAPGTLYCGECTY